VHHAVSVAEGGGLEDLVGEGLDLVGREGPVLAHVLLEVVLAVLEYQVEFVF